MLPQEYRFTTPTTDNHFERYHQLKLISTKMAGVLAVINEEIQQLEEELKDLQDDTYELSPVFDSRKTTIILKDKLKDENPELYAKCLSIVPQNIPKLLGDDLVLKMCKKYAGDERTESASTITLKQMKKVMTDAEYKEYTTETYKIKDYELALKC